MAIKTFNVDEQIYKQFSGFCKNNGISMSKQVEFFMRSVIEEEPKVRQEYLDKLDNIRQEKSIAIGGIDTFKKKYKLE
jgi:antitoxin component of RelBE/YafQ-DinJ toxin-antitoxin module